MDAEVCEEQEPKEEAVGREGEGLPFVLTVAEVRKLLRIGKDEAYRVCRNGEIPGVVPLGKTYRVSRDALLEWLKSGQGRVSRSRGAR